MRGAGKGEREVRRGQLFTSRAGAAACRWLARLLVIGAALIGLGCRAAPLAQRVYVWQRAWTPALVHELAAHARTFSALDVLAAELSFTASGPVIAQPNVSWALLARWHLPVGVVVRIGSLDRGATASAGASSWTDDAPETRCAVDICRKELDRATAAGVEIAELQIDFDAATSRLGDYARLLHRLRHEFPERRLVITVLPTWLRSAEWRNLAWSVDAFVLQVHSLEKPSRLNEPITLFDTGRARQWIREAAVVGRPFRVALPAYGYRIGFSSAGEFLGLEAEAEHRAWPAGTTLKTVVADPREVVRVVQDLRANLPASCKGVAWFRFPIPSDSLAWRWTTLATAMTGVVPAPDVHLRAGESAGGVIDLALANDGTADATLTSWRIMWTGARLIAADALGAATLRRLADESLLLSVGSLAHPVTLGPGEVLRVGWLRLDHPTQIVAQVP